MRREEEDGEERRTRSGMGRKEERDEEGQVRREW